MISSLEKEGMRGSKGNMFPSFGVSVLWGGEFLLKRKRVLRITGFGCRTPTCVCLGVILMIE